MDLFSGGDYTTEFMVAAFAIRGLEWVTDSADNPIGYKDVMGAVLLLLFMSLLADAYPELANGLSALFFVSILLDPSTKKMLESLGVMEKGGKITLKGVDNAQTASYDKTGGSISQNDPIDMSDPDPAPAVAPAVNSNSTATGQNSGGTAQTSFVGQAVTEGEQFIQTDGPTIASIAEDAALAGAVAGA